MSTPTLLGVLKPHQIALLFSPLLTVEVSTAMYSRQGAYFQQEEPRLGNQYLEDSSLLAIVHRLVPADVLARFEPDLVRFGDRVSTSGDILYHGREAELNPPQLVHYNAYGRYDTLFETSTRFPGVN